MYNPVKPYKHEILQSIERTWRTPYVEEISNRQMYSTFNCGIGFVLSVPEREAGQVLSLLPASAPIGRVVKGVGMVNIISAFDGKAVAL